MLQEMGTSSKLFPLVLPIAHKLRIPLKPEICKTEYWRELSKFEETLVNEGLAPNKPLKLSKTRAIKISPLFWNALVEERLPTEE
jgi:hypothetical protein